MTTEENCSKHKHAIEAYEELSTDSNKARKNVGEFWSSKYIAM